MTTVLKRASLLLLPLLIVGCGFATVGQTGVDPPGIVMGIWHGLLAPWTLILRLFMDIHMYAVPNSGWFYDLGFLMGLIFSIPIGWIAAIIAIVVHLL